MIQMKNSKGIDVLSPAMQAATMCGIAAVKHVDQVDAQGDPYIYHCQKVMHYVRKLRPDDYELHAISMGHDLIEDTKSTFSELYTLGFSDRVVDGIRALTNLVGETEEEKMERILANVDSCIVKAGGDLRHNTDIRRGKGLRSKDFERLEKYHRRYQTIKVHLRDSHGIQLF